MRTDSGAAVGAPGSRRLTLAAIIPLDRDPAAGDPATGGLATGDLATGNLDRLAACLAALRSAPRRGVELEVLLVADDASPAVRSVAEAAGARLLAADGTRGARFAAGARAATAEWLLLLRPGTVLEAGWDATLMVFAHDDRNRERGAVYGYRAEGTTPAARRAETAVRFRNRWLGLPSGDQGMVFRRRFLVHLGGVPDLERGEDLVLARRLGRGRLALFDVAAGVRPDTGMGAWVGGALRLLLFLLRVPPRWLQRLGD